MPLRFIVLSSLEGRTIHPEADEFKAEIIGFLTMEKHRDPIGGDA